MEFTEAGEVFFSPHYKNIKFVYTASRFVQYFASMYLSLLLIFSLFFGSLSSFLHLSLSFSVSFTRLRTFWPLPVRPRVDSHYMFRRDKKKNNSNHLNNGEKRENVQYVHANRPSNFIHLRSHACLLNYHTKH